MTAKKFNLKMITKERPIIREVLLTSLNTDCYSEKNKIMQNFLLDIVQNYQNESKTDDYELNESEIGVIMISCCKILRWLHRHPTHAWTKPTKRLLDTLLDNYDVPLEQEDYKEVYKKYDPLYKKV